MATLEREPIHDPIDVRHEGTIRKVLMGNHAVSWGVMRSRVQMISAYPITPQTQIVEELSELCASGKLAAKFIKVESEHSAMASVIGASAAGVRSFTATSAQGLALMHELLHWASLGRLPIVLADVNRAMAPGWSIWCDQTDALAQRDTGLMQWYCETNQEVFDNVILGFKVAERVRLPVMLVLDAFLLSHTYEPVEVSSQALVDEYLPPWDPPSEYVLNLEHPNSFGALTGADYYMELRYKQQLAMDEALRVTVEEGERFKKVFGRHYGLLEQYRCEGAETALLCAGSMAATARDVIDKLHDEGRRVGLIKFRVLRPFPYAALRKAVSGLKKLAILDRNISAGAEGIFAQEVKAALACEEHSPEFHPFILGLGGRDITPEVIRSAIDRAESTSNPTGEGYWLDLKR
jgi:pyruvate/2-oxoacid:ferredoxin oxidoreductase alpha subunit